MTRVVKFEKMECSRCGKVLDSVTNKGEDFYILSVDSGRTRIGVTLDSEEDADEARVMPSGIESDLCPPCYETVMAILREELKNDNLR